MRQERGASWPDRIGEGPSRCPRDHNDHRKTAALAEQRIKPQAGAVVVRDFRFAREILRNPSMLQAGGEIDMADVRDPSEVSFFFLDGDLHRQRRSQVARYFSPKAIEQRYHPVMEAVSHRLLSELRRTGRQRLDIMSFQLAVEVAAEVVGLTNSDPIAMAARIRHNFDAMSLKTGTRLQSLWQKAVQAYRAFLFLHHDVRPAIRARIAEPREDVISNLVKEGSKEKAILIECMTYATAGMLTTREFIVAAAWHLFDRPDVRERYLLGSEDDQMAILYEILRLEPVASMIHRRATVDWTGPNGEKVKAGQVYAIDIRAANTDEKVTGECPFAFDDTRAKNRKIPPMWMSFAEGAHRCPGNLVAFHETRIFLDRLLRLPGVQLATPPAVGWFDAVGGYELHGAIVECDRS